MCVLETGTRGFSGVCMAKALCDSPVSGSVITLDVLPNNVPMYWNCRADHDGKHTRQELLSAWPEELKRMVFIQGDTVFSLRHLGLLRVNFAFLDALY